MFDDDGRAASSGARRADATPIVARRGGDRRARSRRAQGAGVRQRRQRRRRAALRRGAGRAVPRERRGAGRRWRSRPTPRVLTSVANDYRLRARCSRGRSRRSARPGDVALAITTSGASANVNDGAAAARGARAGDHRVDRPRRRRQRRGWPTSTSTCRDADTPRVQEVQRTMLHVMCELVEQRTRRMSRACLRFAPRR